MSAATRRLRSPPTPDCLSDLRKWGRSWTDAHAVGCDVDGVVVAMTELVTNSIRYAPGPVTIELATGPTGLTLAVSDTSDVLPEPREADVEGGRGIAVLAALADRWGVRRREGGGKTVWCEFCAVA